MAPVGRNIYLRVLHSAMFVVLKQKTCNLVVMTDCMFLKGADSIPVLQFSPSLPPNFVLSSQEFPLFLILSLLSHLRKDSFLPIFMVLAQSNVFVFYITLYWAFKVALPGQKRHYIGYGTCLACRIQDYYPQHHITSHKIPPNHLKSDL